MTAVAGRRRRRQDGGGDDGGGRYLTLHQWQGQYIHGPGFWEDRGDKEGAAWRGPLDHYFPIGGIQKNECSLSHRIIITT